MVDENKTTNQNPEDQGRGGDTLLAHMSLGEVVIPRSFLDDPQIAEAIKGIFEAAGTDMREFTVGDPANKINPETGYPEFGLFKSIKKIFKAVAPVVLPILGSIVAPGIGTFLGLGDTALGAIGGALGGAAGSAISGGNVLQGTALGAAGGFAANGGLSNVLGTAAHTLPAGVSGPVTQGSGILGSLGSAGTAISNAGQSILGSLKETTALGGNPLLTLANIGTNLYSADAGTEAAKLAARQQAESTQAAIDANERALSQVRADLQPFKDAGTSTVSSLKELVNDPKAQANYIQSNPLYKSLADDAENRLLANQAAKGKVGSGGTAEALQNSLLLLGNDLLNQNITQKQNLVNTGANAAAQTGTATQNVTNNISGYLTDEGNANAAGTIGAYNAKTGALNNAISTQASIYGIDKGVRI